MFLINNRIVVILARAGKGSGMLSRFRIAVVLTAVLGVVGCSAARSTACQCPKPVAYDDETLSSISKALRALPSDNVLLRAMEDYENERDDLRFCQ
jgi:hypothetical protein